MSLPKQTWIGLLLFFCITAFAAPDAPEVVLTCDRDYFNPFAFGVKYDLSFRNTGKEALWDITCTIRDNRTQKIVRSEPFREMTFKQKKGAFYFFIDSDGKTSSITLCMVGDRTEKRDSTIVNGGLKSHCLTLPLRIVLPLDENHPLFSMKPAGMTANTFPKDFTQSFSGGNGTQEADWTLLLEFRPKSGKGKKLSAGSLR